MNRKKNTQGETQDRITEAETNQDWYLEKDGHNFSARPIIYWKGRKYIQLHALTIREDGVIADVLPLSDDLYREIEILRYKGIDEYAYVAISSQPGKLVATKSGTVELYPEKLYLFISEDPVFSGYSNVKKGI